MNKHFIPLPKDRFDSSENCFHIFREIIITIEEYEYLTKKQLLSPFEEQIVMACKGISEVIDAPVETVQIKAQYNEELN